MSLCIPQTTLLVGSMQKSMSFSTSPFLTQSTLDWNVVQCPHQQRDVLGVLWRWSGLYVTILRLSDIFISLRCLSFTRTIPVALHFLTIFLGTETLNLFASFS